MPRVFLSYSRADEEFATALRQRLETEAPDISLWQDRTQMQGGVGWWQQIQDALERVEFMVLVTSDASLQSEIVRKEWRYARQQSVSFTSNGNTTRPPTGEQSSGRYSSRRASMGWRRDAREAGA